MLAPEYRRIALVNSHKLNVSSVLSHYGTIQVRKFALLAGSVAFMLWLPRGKEMI